MDAHNKAVSLISSRIAHFRQTSTPFRIYHGSTNSTRHAGHSPTAIINTTSLNHVLSIVASSDGLTAIATVEPNVSMAALVAATLKTGYLPQVVPEFPAITVGGTFSGTAAESSSWKYGYFDRSVVKVEMVLGDGRVVMASEDENADLFYGAAGACGTLGVATCFEINLVKAKKYLEVTYLPVYSFEAATQLTDECIKSGAWEYIDGIMYAANMGIIVVGRLTDEKAKGVPVQRFSRWKDPWFYHHAHGQVAHLRGTYCDTCGMVGGRDPSLPQKPVELVPVEDYFFRYDRGSFWLGSYGWPTWATTTRPGRLLFNHWSHTAIAYSILHHSRRHKHFIIQDLAIPRPKAEEFLNWTNEKLCLYPLWLCPIKGGSKADMHKHPAPLVTDVNPSASRSAAAERTRTRTRTTFLASPPATPEQVSSQSETSPAVHSTNQPASSADTSTYILNIGLWGINTTAWPNIQPNLGPVYHEKWLADNRAIEAKVREVGGLKWLYALNFYNEEQFWKQSGHGDGERKLKEHAKNTGIYDKDAYDKLRAKYGAATSTSTGLIEHIPSVWDKTKPRDLQYSEGPGVVAAMIKATFGVEHLLGKKSRKKGGVEKSGGGDAKSKKERKRQEVPVAMAMAMEGREGLFGKKSQEQISVREDDDGDEYELGNMLQQI